VVRANAPALHQTVVFFLAVLWMGTQVVRLGFQEVNLLQRASLLEREKADVAAMHHELRAEIAAAKTNAGVERLAREQLGFVMAEEIPVKAVGSAAIAETPSAPTAPAARPAAEPAGKAQLPPALAALAKFFVPLWR
jgi:cell division protein FtsB